MSLPVVSSAIDLSTTQQQLSEGSPTIYKKAVIKKLCKRTVLVALDLTAAFDTVNHNLLLRDMIRASLPNSTKRVASDLQGRFSYVACNNKKSKGRKHGVTQCGVLSPMLFNIYMSKLPLPPKDINITFYADDIILILHPQVEKLRDLIMPYLKILNDWLELRKVIS